jgi:hypothetical protein
MWSRVTDASTKRHTIPQRERRAKYVRDGCNGRGPYYHQPWKRIHRQVICVRCEVVLGLRQADPEAR